MKATKNHSKQPPRYIVFLRRTDTGYCADVPDLPGCIAAAGTLQSTKKLIAEAVWLHLDLMKESGEAIPRPRQTIEFTIDPESDEEICTWVEATVPRQIAHRKSKTAEAKR